LKPSSAAGAFVNMKRRAGAPAQTKDPGVESLILWRQTNGLSQAETVAFFRANLFDLTLSALKSWESGRTSPRSNTRELLLRFLDQQSVSAEEGAKAKQANKTKYTCPECGQNAWAKPNALLICGACYEENGNAISRMLATPAEK
jgi:hypothetical protein